MSYAYQTEPPTKGKVVLKTTHGDVEIELWPKEAPKAVRNFVQLCMEGYYDNTIFHRIVKNFIVQGGDPTGTGTGGESIYGQPFQDEFHSRLRFMRRGLLAMANVGKNTNTSQFFFTLDAAEELNRKNTIFGKVVGDTVFNVLSMGELETEKNDRPLNPPKIISADILANPFDDIIPRTTPEERAEKAAKEAEERERKSKPKAVKGKKNMSLLSFGDEPEDEGPAVRIKSSHDVLADERLRKDTTKIEEPKLGKEQRKEKRKADDDETTRGISEKKKKWEEEKGLSLMPSEQQKVKVQSEIEKLQQEIRKMDSARRAAAAERDRGKAPSLVDEFRKQYVGKAVIGKRPKRGEETLIEELAAFKTKIFRSEPEEDEDAEKPAFVCDLHGMEDCESCRDTFGVEKEGGDRGWLAHKLKFAKDKANVFEPSVDDYVYFGFTNAVKIFHDNQQALMDLAPVSNRNLTPQTPKRQKTSKSKAEPKADEDINITTSSDWLPKAPHLSFFEDQLRCPICSEFFDTPSFLPCRHAFCSVCIRRHMSKGNNCPVCSAELKNKEKGYRFCLIFTQSVELFKENRSALLDIVRAERSVDGDEISEKENVDADLDFMEDGSLAGSQGSKAARTPKIPKNAKPEPEECRIEDVNEHIDSSCARKTVDLTSRRSRNSGPPETKRYAAIPYSLWKDGQLRKLLRDDGLRSDGDKAMLVKRHSEWIVRLQANQDSGNPRSKDEIRKDLEEWEALTMGKAAAAAHPFSTGSHDVDPKTTKAINSHVAKYGAEFDYLTEQIRMRKRKRMEEKQKQSSRIEQ
ncbi:Peptidyl-prolyl isomerase cwc27 [Phlyctochytrium planicorne]|nr:Peptidyl-prolyl isomerase cwc27 [Phlyctochytrium planicorne]